ncbi:MAG: hypothetical protein CM15mP49_32890 [Actinomycetota bacterium]|nr:MAG: hypothetical protein CM15mP49_32890 [Actinomycetota bacterium]
MSGGMPIKWSDDYPSRFGVMPRAGKDSDVKWFDVNPCYVFHTLNSYEDGDDIVVNGCRLQRFGETHLILPYRVILILKMLQ